MKKFSYENWENEQNYSNKIIEYSVAPLWREKYVRITFLCFLR